MDYENLNKSARTIYTIVCMWCIGAIVALIIIELVITISIPILFAMFISFIIGTMIGIMACSVITDILNHFGITELEI